MLCQPGSVGDLIGQCQIGCKILPCHRAFIGQSQKCWKDRRSRMTFARGGAIVGIDAVNRDRSGHRSAGQAGQMPIKKTACSGGRSGAEQHSCGFCSYLCHFGLRANGRNSKAVEQRAPQNFENILRQVLIRQACGKVLHQHLWLLGSCAALESWQHRREISTATILLFDKYFVKFSRRRSHGGVGIHILCSLL